MAGNYELHVLLHQNKCLPGEKITGTVTLTVNKPIHGAVLVAALQCKEGIWWRDADAVSNCHVAKLQETELALTRVNTSFSIGEYSFPVEFKLPEQSPKHVRLEYDSTKCVVWSSVDATLFVSNKNSPICHATQVFKLIQPTATNIERPVAKPSRIAGTRAFKRFGVLRSDSFSMSISLQDNVVNQATPLKIQIGVTNTLSRAVKSLGAQLVQKVHVTTPSLGLNASRNLCRWDLTSQITGVDGSTESVVSTVLSMSKMESSSLGVTWKSQLLEVSYSIQVECGFGFSYPRLLLSIPVQIVA